MKPNYTYNALVLRVLDGDSIEVQIQLWEGLTYTTQLRLVGIDAPEIHATDPQEKKMGEASRLALEQKLRWGIPFKDGGVKVIYGPQVLVRIIKKDKYAGRWLAEVFLPEDPTNSINDWMLKEGHAKPYDGGKRELGEFLENPFQGGHGHMSDTDFKPQMHEHLSQRGVGNVQSTARTLYTESNVPGHVRDLRAQVDDAYFAAVRQATHEELEEDEIEERRARGEPILGAASPDLVLDALNEYTARRRRIVEDVEKSVEERDAPWLHDRINHCAAEEGFEETPVCNTCGLPARYHKSPEFLERFCKDRA